MYERGRCIFITGAAGFIGYHLIRRLALDDWFIIASDNINDYYDTRLKYARLAEWGIPKEEIEYNKLIVSRYIEKASFIQLDLEDTDNLKQLFDEYDIRVVCHLGAQAGVRYSLENPMAYVNSNVVGFTNILENCRRQKVEHLVYASSSSVYGDNEKQPFSTADRVDTPVSFYAATKKANELMAYVYSHLYQLPTTGLRFFTVYGPWGRPDMSPMLFADAILNDEPVKVFNEGKMARDFTYIDDIVDGIETILKKGPRKRPADEVPAALYNIGRGEPVKLLDYIKALEQALGKKAKLQLMPMQPGDVVSTWCDVTDLERDYGYKPKTSLKEGLQRFAEWYKAWYTGSRPLIEEEKIVVGVFPFPSVMNWQYVWSNHLEKNFRLSEDPDRLLKSMIVSDGFDEGPSLIEVEAWKQYVAWQVAELGLQPKDTVFEVGCGGGAFLFPLYREGYRVSGIDYASNLIHLAKLAMPGVPFKTCEAKELPLKPMADVVVANSVFQYFDSLEEAKDVLLLMLKKAKRTVAVLNVPDAASERQELLASAGTLELALYDQKYRHLTHLRYTREWFQDLADRAGCSVRFYNQSIEGYGLNEFRFNAVFSLR